MKRIVYTDFINFDKRLESDFKTIEELKIDLHNALEENKPSKALSVSREIDKYVLKFLKESFI